MRNLRGRRMGDGRLPSWNRGSFGPVRFQLGSASRWRRTGQVCMMLGNLLVVVFLVVACTDSRGGIVSGADSQDVSVARARDSGFQTDKRQLGTMMDSLLYGEDLGDCGYASYPGLFASEVMSLDGCQNIQFDERTNTIGFSWPENARQAFRKIAGRLKAGGWSAVTSGSDVMGSFLKQEGAIRWVMVSCYDLAAEACVVVQYQ